MKANFLLALAAFFLLVASVGCKKTPERAKLPPEEEKRLNDLEGKKLIKDKITINKGQKLLNEIIVVNGGVSGTAGITSTAAITAVDNEMKDDPILKKGWDELKTKLNDKELQDIIKAATVSDRQAFAETTELILKVFSFAASAKRMHQEAGSLANDQQAYKNYYEDKVKEYHNVAKTLEKDAKAIENKFSSAFKQKLGNYIKNHPFTEIDF